MEGERLSVVIEEKRVLEKDIKARAEQQKESDRLIEEMEAGIAKLAQSIEKRSLTTEQLVEKIVEVSVQIQKLIEVMAQNRILDQTVGLIPGVQKLQEAYVEWRLLFIKLPSHEGTIEFDKYLYHQFKVLQQLLDRVREDGKPIKIDELTANPELSDKIAEIAKSNYPPALVDSVKKLPLGSGG